MPVFHLTANYKFLEKIGVSPGSIEKLKAKKIQLGVGFHELRFSNSSGEELVVIKLSKSTSDMAKGLVGTNTLKQIVSQVEHTIDKIYFPKLEHNVTQTSVPTIPPIPPTTQELSLDTTSGNPATGKPAWMVSEEVVSEIKEIANLKTEQDIEEQIMEDESKTLSGGLPRLRDATAMYQAVRGTDAHSVYYVVALSQTAKVAIKMNVGSHYSIRVEGANISNQSKLAMQELGITLKGDYLSGHFHNPDHVPVQRSIGAILASLGIDFDTKIPNMAHVMSLCGVK